jgi:hypothetical protein
VIAGTIALLAVTAQPNAGTPPAAEFVAGRTRLGGWQVEAVTAVNNEASPPLIGNSRCTIAGRGLHLVVQRESGGGLRIGGAGAPFADSDIVAIELGGRVYEARMLPISVHRVRYSDVDYPPGHTDPEAATSIEHWLGVRHRPADPWLNVGNLLVDLFEVRSIGISYRADDRVMRTRLSVAGLRDAVLWCERTFDSDRARRLPNR